MRKYERLAMDEAGNAIYETVENGQVVETLTPEQKDKNLFREKEFVFLFQRVALNPMTMQNISAWFVQKIIYKIPNKDGFDFHWFFWSKDVSLPHVKVLDSRLGRLAGFCFAVNVNDKTYVRKTAQPKRLSKELAQKILKDKVYENLPFLGIFGESDGAEFVQPKRD